MNSFVLYNLIAVQAGLRPISENDFRDKLVLQIIHKYGRGKQENERQPGRPPRSEYREKHGSKPYPIMGKARCQFCRLNGQTNWTQRKWPDCPFLPALCQTLEKDCHSVWHEPCFDELRNLWVAKRMDKHQSRPSAPEPRVLRSRGQLQEPLETCTLQEASGSSALTPQDLVESAGPSNLRIRQEQQQLSATIVKRRPGRPQGAVNKRRRHGKYHSKL